MARSVRSAPPLPEFTDPLLDAWRRILRDAPTGFAITRGPAHVLTFANDAFLAPLGEENGAVLGRPVTEHAGPYGELADLLDRAFDLAVVYSDEPMGTSPDGEASWNCSVWPLRPEDDGAVAGLVIEVRASNNGRAVIGLQRRIAERLLLCALREQDYADEARSSHVRAAFLAGESGRLAGSIDQSATRESVAGLHLLNVAAWCIVDLIEDSGASRRLAIVHPDHEKQEVLRKLFARLPPHRGERFGVEAVRRASGPVTVTEHVASALGLGPSLERSGMTLEIGSLLTVPMKMGKQLLGALTFVGTAEGRTYSAEELDLATKLASHAAVALDNARLHSEAVTLRAEALKASESKSEFLAQVSHELRNPLNAILGYVDLIEEGVYGPVNEQQHTALSRIIASEKQLLVMINDLLSFFQVQSGRLKFTVTDFPVDEFLSEMFVLIQPTMDVKRLTNRAVSCPPGLAVRADRERTVQILLNLLGNAVKFTPEAGEVWAVCEAKADSVMIHVIDTGVGIPDGQLATVFDPFVQGTDAYVRRTGVGLGLAISRDLARAMAGEVTVESTPGKGSRFTLRLPRAPARG